jgi:glycosyltransferase involved in cell wall biosynthesis
MATYNGEPYVREQLESILAELGPQDEVIVADDASTDATLEVLASVGDRRVVVLAAEANMGHVRTFERAMRAAQGDIVMLADQDDVWPRGRVAALTAALQGYPVAAGNLQVFGGGPAPDLPDLRRQESGANARNIAGILLGRRAYFGSAMAYRAELAPTLLPVPSFVEAHDLWLALAGSVAGGVAHVESPVVLRRVHGQNLTPQSRRSLRRVAMTRVRMLAQLVLLVLRRSRAAARA